MRQNDWLEEFQNKMRERLEMGLQKYGDALENNHNLVIDIKEELLDLANYAYLMYARVSAMEASMSKEIKGVDDDRVCEKD